MGEYMSVKDLAKYLGIAYSQMYELSKSQRLRQIKGAVININKAGGKHEVLRINVKSAIKALEVQ
jgi:hypothetical protein